MNASPNLRQLGSALGAVSDWMSHDPAAVVEDCPIRWALTQMEQGGFRHLLVLDGERLSGIVSSRDVRRLAVEDLHAPWLAEPVRRIMTEDPVTIGAGEPVTDAARLLLDLKIGALPVRGPDGIIGIFTIADALEALLAMAEGPAA
jgi:acetoin utilization protein AcuB